MLRKIISGAQTGADRAGLDAAKILNLETGGWIPKGGKTESGLEPHLIELYALQEHPSSNYPPRTELNVKDSDGTVLFGESSSPGSKLTIDLCHKHRKPVEVNPSAEGVRKFVEAHKIMVLNVAGNRESRNPGIWQRTLEILLEGLGVPVGAFSKPVVVKP